MEEFDLLNDRDGLIEKEDASPINELKDSKNENLESSMNFSQGSVFDLENFPLFEFPEPNISVNMEFPEDLIELLKTNSSLSSDFQTFNNSAINQQITNFSELTSKTLNLFSEEILNNQKDIFSVLNQTAETNSSSIESISTFESNINSIFNNNESQMEEINSAMTNFFENLEEKSDSISQITNNFETLEKNEFITNSKNFENSSNMIEKSIISDSLEVSRTQDSLKELISLKNEISEVKSNHLEKSTNETSQTISPQIIESEVSKQLALEKSTEPVAIEDKSTNETQIINNFDTSAMEARLARIEKLLLSPLEVKIVN